MPPQQQALFVSGNCMLNFRFSLACFVSLFLLGSCQPTNEELINKAFNLSKEKKYEEAVKVFSDVIKKNERLQLAYYNRRHCYMALKEYKRALFDFEKSDELADS